ncbi:MAG TPA: ferredoxin reductase [Anaerolineales bacterium]
MLNRALEWQIATIAAIQAETARTKTFTLSLPAWVRHLPGQHYDLRLTAEDGYQAQRSYSIASEPEHPGQVDLTVERLPDGEVSGYLHDVLVPGDRLEVRGPIGGYFVWEASRGGPLLLVAGGSGVVPLMSMLRHRRAVGSSVPARLLYSSRTPEDVIYADELRSLHEDADGLEVLHTFTRAQPAGWTGYARRIDAAMLKEISTPLGGKTQVFICGPTLLVEGAADGLVAAGLAPGRIKTERFGPSGGSA